MKNLIMGVDQFNNTYHDLGSYPRKELLNRLNCKTAKKMYRDKTDGSSVLIGYIVRDFWITLYEVKPFEVKE